MKTRASGPPLSLAVLAWGVSLGPVSVRAQAPPYSDSLLPRVRAIAQSLPGARPLAVHYLSFAEAAAASSLSSLVADADTQQVTPTVPVFQIRFEHSWIMVDAGGDRQAWLEYYGPTFRITYWQDLYDRVQAALRDADKVVLTHEHLDHAVGVERGPYFQQVAAKTFLNPRQLRSLRDRSVPAVIPIAADSASAFTLTPDELLYPLAPGVVLIQAPGHTPGSQLVYVQLAGGQEILLIGDLVWMMAGLERDHQKPQGVSESLKEDRAAIQAAMHWMRRIIGTTSIAVVPSHDKRRLDSLVMMGILKPDLDLTRP